MTVAIRPPLPLPLLRFWFLRLLPMWCLIASMIFLIQIAICGIVRDNETVKTFLSFIDMLPSFVKSTLGGDALQVDNTTALIAIGYRHPLVMLLYMLFAVAVPTGLLTGEVQQGRMELILSRATTKTQVYLCAAILTICGMFALVLVMFFGTFVATNIYTFNEAVPLHRFFMIAINGGLLASAVGGISLLSAALFRRRGSAIGLAVVYLVVNYFIAIIAQWWPIMKSLGPMTLFWYVDDSTIFREAAWPVGNMIVLISVLVIATVTGGVIWYRRDLPL